MEERIIRIPRGLTRRQALADLTLLMAALGSTGSIAPAAEESSSTFLAQGLNHIALSVTDIARSRDFYVKHLGLRVSSESSSSCFLTCGAQFVALFRNREPGMHHYCYGIDDYSVKSAAERLRAQGFTPRIAGNRIYFDDPDGIEVQLSAMDHRA